MISVQSLEQAHASCAAPELDARVSRLLDCAVFFHARHDPKTGVTTTWWQLRKTVYPYPRGTVMTLATLHRILFCE